MKGTAGSCAEEETLVLRAFSNENQGGRFKGK
jgi:hypothetical protein